MNPQFHLFIPQMRLAPSDLVARAQAAERAGFHGLALMDHLVPPQAEDQPMFEAMTTATWLAARTEHLSLGHLVLCDAIRAPAVLARQAVTLDHFSGGRFELAIGSGSTPLELTAFGLGGLNQRQRTERLGETLDVLKGLWSAEPFSYAGRYHFLEGAQQVPAPTRPIPIIIGGTGPMTMKLVAAHADWWNVPLHHADRLTELRSQAGSARVSLQQMVTFVPAGQSSEEILAKSARRFSWLADQGKAAGSGPALAEHFSTLHERGIDRFYIWFADFAAPDTLEEFGTEVIAPLQ